MGEEDSSCQGDLTAAALLTLLFPTGAGVLFRLAAGERHSRAGELTWVSTMHIHQSQPAKHSPGIMLAQASEYRLVCRKIMPEKLSA